MTSFEDGPAKGKALGLRRTPVFLRVVQNRKGEWDALDQLGDSASAGETAYVYELASFDGSVIICARGKGGGRFGLARYRMYAVQPPQETLLSNTEWAEWARAEYEKREAKSCESNAK